MPLTSNLRAYDPRWPVMFAMAAADLRPVFGENLLAFEHVGSTAVPGLSAKPEIDMVAIVGCSEAIDAWTARLAKLGYRRGGDLSPGHRFFKRDVNGVRTHKLHVCRAGHETAAAMLRFRDHLRTSPGDRDLYGELKIRLEAENRHGIHEYLERKVPFIREIMARLD